MKEGAPITIGFLFCVLNIMPSSFNSYTAGVLDGLSPEVTQALLSTGTRMHFSNGQLIQTRGDLAVGLAVIIRGHVRMTTLCEDGSELLCSIFGPGQQFNEVTLFAEAARTHDAVAVGDVELLFLDGGAYIKFSKAFPEIVQALLVSNVQRVHQLIELLNDVRALPKVVVLARILYKNAWRARESQNSKVIEIDIAQDDIAMFLGVTRPYLNKMFAHLSDAGLITLAYRKVRILDMDSLNHWIKQNLRYTLVDESKFSNLPVSAVAHSSPASVA